MQLTTPRLLLRAPVAGDRRALHEEVYGHPRVMRWLPGGVPLPLERTEAILAALERHWDDLGYGVWTVTKQADGRVIGHCGLRHIGELGVVELLYALGPGHWGQGYATEAARAAVEWASIHTGLREIAAFSKAGNFASEAVLAKCGFRSAGPTQVFGLRALAWTRRLRSGYPRPDHKASLSRP